MGFWPVVIAMIRNVDIVVVVGDARMPDISINQETVNIAQQKGKRVVKVFTKSDLVSKHQLALLRTQFPDAYFVAGVKNEGVSALRRGLQILAKQFRLDEPKIGIAGYPNIGKSALINALARGRRAHVSNQPGTTKGVQWVKVGGLMILDSPGVIPVEDKNRKLALLGSKSPEKLNAPEKNAFDILTMLVVKAPEQLMKHYHLSEIPSELYDLLIAIGTSRHFLKKGGTIDEDRTAKMIIREWQTGKLRVS